MMHLALVVGMALVLPSVVNPDRNWQRALLFAIASLLGLRYAYWRLTATLAPAGLTIDCLASWSFFFFEMAALNGSISAFVIMSRTRQRQDEVAAHLGWWAPAPDPHVAILIATYNEELEVLERTIVGALALNHPVKEVLILDDGRRDWLRDYCAAKGVRYLRRPDSRGSKAGNINHALGVLASDARPPDFIAVLDADFVPHRGFISRSLALFHDPDVGLVQTPQHFFNPDPIQHNLSLSRSYPDEQRFFFDHMQPARDAWGIAFCCGTSSLLRWQAVQDAGGFPTESITEDFMMTLSLQDKGWRTVYLNEPLTEGLAPEGLKEYVTQRALGSWPDADRPQPVGPVVAQQPAPARPLERHRLGFLLAYDISIPHRRPDLSAALLVFQHHRGERQRAGCTQLLWHLFPVGHHVAEHRDARVGGAHRQRCKPAFGGVTHHPRRHCRVDQAEGACVHRDRQGW